jgi:hypothetical protein
MLLEVMVVGTLVSSAAAHPDHKQIVAAATMV